MGMHACEGLTQCSLVEQVALAFLRRQIGHEHEQEMELEDELGSRAFPWILHGCSPQTPDLRWLRTWKFKSNKPFCPLSYFCSGFCRRVHILSGFFHYLLCDGCLICGHECLH